MTTKCKNSCVLGLGVHLMAATVLPLVFSFTLYSQRIAILIPEKNPQAEAVANEISSSIAHHATVIDNSLADAAFRSVHIENVFNLTLDEGKRIGSVIGCDAFLLVKAESLRRTSSAKASYYESYAAIFAVDSRTGHLISWKLQNAEESSLQSAEKKLAELIQVGKQATAREILDSIGHDTAAVRNGEFNEMPAEGSEESNGFRPPIPYLRIKPEYTTLAYLYSAKGTVEILVDLDDKGTIVATEIERWVGFGLEDSVIQAVRKMNWRPAERAGKPLPSRFLLRYNFKKIERE